MIENNAIQVKNLVKETFTKQNFNAHDASFDCHDHDESHECNWKRASRPGASPSEESRAAAIGSFYKVGGSTLFSKIIFSQAV